MSIADTASTDLEHTTSTWSIAPAERRTAVMGRQDWRPAGLSSRYLGYWVPSLTLLARERPEENCFLTLFQEKYTQIVPVRIAFKYMIFRAANCVIWSLLRGSGKWQGTFCCKGSSLFLHSALTSVRLKVLRNIFPSYNHSIIGHQTVHTSYREYFNQLHRENAMKC